MYRLNGSLIANTITHCLCHTHAVFVFVCMCSLSLSLSLSHLSTSSPHQYLSLHLFLSPTLPSSTLSHIAIDRHPGTRHLRGGGWSTGGRGTSERVPGRVQPGSKVHMRRDQPTGCSFRRAICRGDPQTCWRGTRVSQAGHRCSRGTERRTTRPQLTAPLQGDLENVDLQRVEPLAGGAPEELGSVHRAGQEGVCCQTGSQHCSNTRKLSHTHTHKHTKSLSHLLPRSLTRIHMHTHIQSYIHAHTRSHTHTHTHIHTPPLSEIGCFIGEAGVDSAACIRRSKRTVARKGCAIRCAHGMYTVPSCHACSCVCVCVFLVRC
jgi:hypothetical protein